MPIENTRRELDYKIHLARHFCNQGLKVIIGNPPYIRDELRYKNYRCVFLEKGLNPSPNYYKFLKEKDILLFDLSDEGASFPVYAGINYQPTMDSMMHMKSIFLWGESQKKDLEIRNDNKKLIEKYIISGYPGLDLCSIKFRSFQEACFDYKKIPSSYIIVNTNFAYVNGNSWDDFREACSIMSPAGLEKEKTEAQNNKVSFVYFKKILDSIIKRFPNENFLIRPHPCELKKRYEDMFRGFKNVIISKDGNASQAISRAKLVIHSDCTTALQGYLMGVPVMSLAYSYMNHVNAPWALAFGTLPKTIKETVENIEYVLEHNEWREVDKNRIEQQAREQLRHTFSHIGLSTFIVVNTIMAAVQEKWPAPHSYNLQDSRTLFEKIKYQIRKKMPLHYKIPKAARETFVEFTKKDIIKRLYLLESVEPLGCQYGVKKIFPNTFEISLTGYKK